MTVGKKAILAAAVALAAITQAVSAQVYTPAQAPPYYTSPPVSAVPTTPQLNEPQLEQLVGPVALYPDPLLGEVLTGATYPQDVSAAASWIQTYPNQPDDVINTQPWDASIKALAHYPSVLQMMGSNLDWTSTLGSAFISQQGDLLNAVQQLRLRAQAAGNLATNPQEQVVVDSGTVDIVPVTNTVYVPVYDPAVVYTQPYAIQYGTGFLIGPWLNVDFDWHRRGILLGHDWDHRFDVHEDRSHEHAWVRDFQRPLPSVRPGVVVAPPRSIEHPSPDPHRGFVAAPTPGAFGGVQPRDEVQRDHDRGVVVQHPPVISPPVRPPTPPVVHPPQPIPVRPAPPQPVRPIAPPPPVVRPTAPSLPQLHSNGQGAFAPVPRAPAQAQSSRGNASMGRK